MSCPSPSNFQPSPVLQISMLDEAKLVHIYLFISKGSQDVTNSVNHQMATSDLWKQPGPQKDGLPTPSFLDTVVANMVGQLTLDSPACSPICLHRDPQPSGWCRGHVKSAHPQLWSPALGERSS